MALTADSTSALEMAEGKTYLTSCEHDTTPLPVVEAPPVVDDAPPEAAVVRDGCSGSMEGVVDGDAPKDSEGVTDGVLDGLAPNDNDAVGDSDGGAREGDEPCDGDTEIDAVGDALGTTPLQTASGGERMSVCFFFGEFFYYYF